MERGAPIAILRLSKVLSPAMPLFRDWIEGFAVGRRIRAFHDMRMAPTPIDIAVNAIIALMCEEARGIFQLTGPRDASYDEIARYLVVRIGADPTLVEPTHVPASMPAGSTPFHTTLDSTALRNTYGLVVPDVWEVVEPFVSLTARRR
jgi:dTDP-4-dehydrorhamnose reductase